MLHPRVLFLALLSAPLAHAGDHWIDPVQGSDTNGGSSAADAWRSLTHALDAIGPHVTGGDVETLHLLPGTYSALSGEVFPVSLRESLRIVAVTDAASTVVQGDPGQAAFHVRNGAFPAEPLALSDITITGAETALLSTPGIPSVQIECDRVVLRQNDHGVRSEPGFAGGLTFLTLRGCVLRGNDIGVGLARANVVRIADSVIRENAWGIRAFTSGGAFGSSMQIDVERTRVVTNDRGISLRPAGSNITIDVDVRDSLFAGNVVAVEREEDDATALLGLQRCTLTQNGAGLSVWPTATDPLEVDESILFDNGQDVTGNVAAVTLTNSLVGVDPLFVDPQAGDFRPGYGSPALDAGSAPAGTFDLVQRHRVEDGDADLVRASDLGAFELARLDGPTSAPIGSTLVLELFGEPGRRTLLRFGRGLPLVTPLQTPFGELFLDPSALREFGVVRHAGVGPGPTLIAVDVPNDPTLAGRSFTFQGLSRASNAPAGAAYGGTVTVRFE